MRILFAAGGTAGHINPAVAVANYIRERESDAEFLFVGTEEGMESALVPKQGYDIRFIKIHGFERSLSLKNFKTAGEIFTGIHSAKRIIREFCPDVVMGTGGYVSGPVLYAAHRLGIPTLVHESNAYPGVTVRISARFADVTALGMDEAGDYLSGVRRLVTTGNPIRPSILKRTRKEARTALGLDDAPCVLIFGGSLGANRLNEAAVDWISDIAERDDVNIIMSTGKNNQYDAVLKRFEKNGVDLEKHKRIRVSSYIYDMDIALNAADLIVARSGSSVSEMTALGKPAILIPSPYVTGNHQEHNARAVENAGGAIVICESELSGESLGEKAHELLADPKRLEEMSRCAMKIGVRDATEKICVLLGELADRRKE